MTPQEEINRLKQEVIDLESRIATESEMEILKQREIGQLKQKVIDLENHIVTENETDQLKKRMNYLESHIVTIEHALDKNGIIKPTDYPPYIPWKVPTPVESMFKPSEWMNTPPKK
jgi:hypothetical protein